MKVFFSVALAMVVVFVIIGASLQMIPADEQMTEEETYKELSKDLSGLQELLLNSPIPMWQCGDPPTWVPKREDYPDIKEFHMAVAGFRAQSYAWMSCAMEYIHVYPFAVDEWGEQLIKENEVIIQ